MANIRRPRTNMLGLVLAGGKSSRFGSEKALAGFHGRPLIMWSISRLEQCCSKVGVSAPLNSGVAGYVSALGYEVIPDKIEGQRGALAGIVAGLAWANRSGVEYLATLPCDVPFLPEILFDRLADSLTSHAGAFAKTTK